MAIMRISLALVFVTFLTSACNGKKSADDTDASANAVCDSSTDNIGTPYPETPAILSAFIGVYQVPAPLFPTPDRCELTGLQSGMPIVLTHEVDRDTLEESDILIVLNDGTELHPLCADPHPAEEENEDRSILLVGNLGDASNPPVEVRIVDELLAEPYTPGGSRDLLGLRFEEITPLDVGPSLIWAERLPQTEAETGGDADCPENRTVQIVQTTWAGGVTGPLGQELADEQRNRMHVLLEGESENSSWVIPFALGDLQDGDNNVDLCLDLSGVPLQVRVESNTVTDPINDYNPETSVVVYDGWGQSQCRD